MNFLRRILQLCACILLGMYVALIFALDQPRVQKYLAEVTATELGKVMDTDIEIDHITVGLFNAVELHDVLLYDQNHKPLLKSKLIYGKIRIFSLLNGKIDLRNISIIDGTIKLYKEREDSDVNMKFIIDAFKSDRKEKKPLNLTINSLLLRRCQIAYDEEYVPYPADNRFSQHHIFCHDVNVNLSLKEMTNDNINLRVRQLSFTEQSGLSVDELRLRLTANRSKAEIKDLVIKLPNSRIEQPELTLNYDLSDSKNVINTLHLAGNFNDIRLSAYDLSAFVPALKDFGETFVVSTQLSVQKGAISLNNLSLANTSGTFAFDGNVDYHKDETDRTGITAGVRNLLVEQVFINHIFNNIVQKPTPSQLKALGDVAFAGDVKYLLNPKSNYTSSSAGMVKGQLTTSLGILDTDITQDNNLLEVKLASSSFKPSALIEGRFVPTAIDFSMTAKTATDLSQLNAAADKVGNLRIGATEADLKVNSVTINNQTYKNIHATANYLNSSVKARLTTDDTAAKMQVDLAALMDAAKPWAALPSNVAFELNIDHLVPAQLHLTNHFGQGVLALNAFGNLNSLDLNHLDADIAVSDFILRGDNNNETPYHLQGLNLYARPLANGNHVRLRSDFIDLDYSGPLQPERLKAMAKNFYNSIHDGMFNESMSANDIADAPAAGYDNYTKDVNFILTLHDAEFFNRILGTKINYRGAIQAQGAASSDGKHLSATANAPTLSFGKFTLNDLSLFVRSEEGSFNVLGKGRKLLPNGDVRAELTAINRDGHIYTDIEWDEGIHHGFYGKLSAISTLETPYSHKPTALQIPTTESTAANEAEESATPASSFSFTTEFTPSQLCIGDSIWQFVHSRLEYRDKRLKIEGFGIHNDTQSLSINGVYDRAFEDAITVDLNNLDLDYVLAFTRINNVVEFSGHATGKIFVKALPNGDPWAKAEVNVPDLLFNHAPLGNADVTLGWDHAERDITIDGRIKEEGIGYTNVWGYVDPVNRDLDLRTESKNTQLGFLNKYTADIFSNVSGRATGHCRIYGGFQTIEFAGHEIGQCEATIPVTGVTYMVKNADVEIVSDAFIIKQATINDKYYGEGSASGVLSHEHIKDMKYDFTLEGNNLRLYDKPRELDMPFFATATGSGNVRIYGKPGELNAEMHIRTTAGSELTYLLDSPDADVSQLLTFHDVTPVDNDTIATLQPVFPVEETFERHYVPSTTMETVQTPTDTDINLYFDVDVDDNSCLHLITDDKSGDAITTYGSGHIQANYHNKSGFQMYGTYNIDRGTYNLNIPTLAQRRKFDILSGGRVTFSGDPASAEVQVKAQYVVNSASLADLNIGTGFANNTTRVNCLANIYGEVANMQFDLGLELPNCSQDEQQMVNNLIATDEDRTMQVLYLMGVGRFYAYNYTTSDIGQSQSVLMMNSLISSTLSSQLNNIISNAVGSSNWTFGTNISTGQLGWNDMEVEGLVSSRLLNNRLLINGNFGYSDRQAATTNFVGDFDMQYLITPKGTVSIKAYSETNDRYFTKSTLTTQGVGLQLKKDFTRFIDLFRRKRAHNMFEQN